MNETRTYFREQFRLNKLTFHYEGEASDFYLGSWQRGRSPIPLFCIRLLLFIGCVGIFIASLVIISQNYNPLFWPIYMTHWGVFLIVVASGCATLVSFMATINGSIDSNPLPWYVKLYWGMYSVTLCVAFLITIFYYALIYPSKTFDEYKNRVLDLFVHCVNSIVAFLLMATARHPVHLLQFLYPLLCTIVYMTFSVIYYYAGGTNPNGDGWIYRVLDWSKPGRTTGLVFAVAVFLLMLHILIVCLSTLRDIITRRYVINYSPSYVIFTSIR